MSIFDYKASDISGSEVELKKFNGKPSIIVNTASACGFTPQYEQLEQLYKEMDGKINILAFPCNQFGAQESGSNEEIKEFCDLKFNITFDLFDKIDVNGEKAHPLYGFLKKEKPGLLGSQKIKWNFTKFLIDSDGKPVKRYAPSTNPLDIKADIQKLLK